MSRRFNPLGLSASLALGVSLGIVAYPSSQGEQHAMFASSAEAALKLKLSKRKIVADPGQRISFQLSGASTYQVVSSKPGLGSLLIDPSGFPVDAAGQLGWPTAGVANGNYKVTIEGSAGSQKGSTTLVIALGKPNHAPKFKKLEAAKIVAGEQVVVKFEASDKDKDSLTYSVERANGSFVMPEGSSLTGNRFIWNTGGDQAHGGDNGRGLYKFKVSVSDGAATVSKVLQIQLKEPKKVKNEKPRLAAPGNHAAVVNDETCFDLDVRDDKTAYEDLEMNIVSGNENASIGLGDDDKWQFCFAPEAAGKFDFAIEAVDEAGLSSGSKSFTVNADSVPHSPIIEGIDVDGQFLTTEPAEITVEENEPLYFQVLAIDPDEDAGDTLTYRISALDQYFDSKTGIFDMPAASTPRTVNATVTVTDSAGYKTTRGLAIRITPASTDPGNGGVIRRQSCWFKEIDGVTRLAKINLSFRSLWLTKSPFRADARLSQTLHRRVTSTSGGSMTLSSSGKKRYRPAWTQDLSVLPAK